MAMSLGFSYTYVPFWENYDVNFPFFCRKIGAIIIKILMSCVFILRDYLINWLNLTFHVLTFGEPHTITKVKLSIYKKLITDSG